MNPTNAYKYNLFMHTTAKGSMVPERNPEGQFKIEITTENTFDFFRQREDQAEPFTVNDIDEKVDWSRRTIHNKLEDLVTEGKLKTKKTGSRGRVWWVPLPREAAPISTMGLTATELPDTPESVLETAGEAIPGRKEKDRRERAEAVLTAYKFLQRRGSAQTGEIQEYTHDKHEEDDTDKLDGAERQWVNYLRDGLAELPGVERPPRGTHSWSYLEPGGRIEQALDVELDDWVLELDFLSGREEEAVNRQRSLIQLAYNHLKEEGSAEKSDIKESLPDYTAHYSDFSGLWSYCIRKALQDAPGVEPPGPGHTTWRYSR